ncbi:MAG: hypothetical protein AB4042_02025 [Leptolyngbyaceae cyanobacterium]
MFTSLKVVSSLVILCSLFAIASTPTLSGKNPGCDDEVHICPTEQESLRLTSVI